MERADTGDRSMVFGEKFLAAKTLDRGCFRGNAPKTKYLSFEGDVPD